MTLSTGTVINSRYRIVRLIGQGGFGAVYRAWDMSLTQPVALKENIDSGDASQRQFEHEARLLAGLRHNNLPRVIDHFILPGQGQYLVMDYVEGKSLGELLRERGGPLGEAEVLPWVHQVADALTYLHTRTPPVIHRDVKPDNIIITADGRAVLVDFGISKIYDPNASTTVGAKAVTPGYSPPEQYGRGRTDARSDVYSLGATLYTLLTGLVPPDGPDLSSGADTLTPPRQVNTAISEATSLAVAAAMAPMVSQRLASVAEFEKRLPIGAAVVSTPAPAVSPLATTTTPMSTPSGIGSPPSGKARGSRVPIWGWLAGVAALIALAAWAGATFGGRDGGTAEAEATATVEAIAETLEIVEIFPSPTETPTLSPTLESSATATIAPEPSLTVTATTPPQPQAGDVRVMTRGGVEVEQAYVAAGAFMMGSDDGEADESPVHEVTLESFWIDRTEVTNEQYATCVADGACDSPIQNSSHTRVSYFDNPQYVDYPVIYVGWQDAQDFCEWTDSRLPTEAEWEYAARGINNSTYPWGNQQITCELANYWGNVNGCVEDTTRVGEYPDGASWIGTLDMAGNVWEWVNDWHDGTYYQSSPVGNPIGPAEGLYRVFRGGARNDSADSARSAFRGYNLPGDGYNDVGFRCVTGHVLANLDSTSSTALATPEVVRTHASILLIQPAGCEQPGNFRDISTIEFQWRYEAPLRSNEYLEMRIEPNAGVASQGKVTSSVNGIWRQAISVPNFDIDAGSYRWMVVHMSADGHTELATSDYGCFTIWSSN